jgi:hypothetical protein
MFRRAFREPFFSRNVRPSGNRSTAAAVVVDPPSLSVQTRDTKPTTGAGITTYVPLPCRSPSVFVDDKALVYINQERCQGDL